MADEIPFEEVVKVFYSVLLRREPRDEELGPYRDAYARGDSLDQLATGILESSEARLMRVPRLIDSLSTEGARQVASACPVTLRADDVMNIIARVYEVILGRHPAFREVSAHFVEILNGTPIADLVGVIADSDEARLAKINGSTRVLDGRDKFGDFMNAVYQRCFGRIIGDAETNVWYEHFRKGLDYPDIFLSINNSAEAKSRDSFLDWDIGTFVQLAYEIILGRGASPGEIDYYRKSIEAGVISQRDVLTSFFLQAGRSAIAEAETPAVANDPTQAYIFGRQAPLTLAEWRARREELKTMPTPVKVSNFARFPFISKGQPLVSIITSLYKGARFIKHFLSNISEQTIFSDCCELLIFDADSPEGEFEQAESFLKRFPNIHYRRLDHRIGIYEAWNLGVMEARGEYCTNANLDDCRREDSLELQAASLDALAFVDVVYQDVLYSFDENLPFAEIERFDFATKLPIVSRYNLLEFNMPHNGPMWRRRLHDEIGLFNATYKSAGDFDFWMRCLVAGKTFYKLNEAHVAYFINPKGLSTRTDTPGAAESSTITKMLNRQLVSHNLTMSGAAFEDKLAGLAGNRVRSADRYSMAQTALRMVSVASRADHLERR